MFLRIYMCIVHGVNKSIYVSIVWNYFLKVSSHSQA